jgi:hypothetical protein
VKALVVIAFALVVAAAGTVAIAGWGRSTEPAETRAKLDAVVVEHVRHLLSNRFDAAWARMHADDRRAIGRRSWEECKRVPDGALGAVRYSGVRVLRVKGMTFGSPLHDRVSAVAVTVGVQAAFSGEPLRVTDVSHWVLDDGRWARLVESRKLAAYARGQCPSS